MTTKKELVESLPAIIDIKHPNGIGITYDVTTKAELIAFIWSSALAISTFTSNKTNSKEEITKVYKMIPGHKLASVMQAVKYGNSDHFVSLTVPQIFASITDKELNDIYDKAYNYLIEQGYQFSTDHHGN